jgi:hypothetical protein
MADWYGKYDIFIGVNGTGKTTVIKKLIAPYRRVLIVPSSVYDIRESWAGYRTVRPALKEFEDKKRGKKRKAWFVPGLNRISEKTVLDLSELRTAEDQKEVMDSITSNLGDGFEHGYLVIDDTKNYIPSGGDLPHLFKQLLISRRQRRVHLAFAYHSIPQINPDLLTYGPRFFLFRTDRAPSGEVLSKFNNPEAFEELRRHVNETAQTKPHYFQPFQPA